MTGPSSTSQSTSRRRLLAFLGASASTILGGCSDLTEDEVEYEDGGSVGNLSAPAADNGSETNEAIAARAHAELADDSYAVELAALELRAHDISVKSDYRGVVVEGRVENTGEERIEYVEVRTRIYDEDGAQLGRYLDSTGDLAGGSTWRFEIIVLEQPGEVGSYDIAVLGALG